MDKYARENLTELFERWLDPSQARTAASEVQAVERMFTDYPAPLPRTQTLEQIRGAICARLSRRRRVALFAKGLATVAAAIVLTVVGLSRHTLDHPRGQVNSASLIPASLWESDDLSSDDAQLAYFTSEINTLEDQVQALRSGDFEGGGAGALDEVELELFQIDTEFWKG
jgi:hypothetical protein